MDKIISTNLRFFSTSTYEDINLSYDVASGSEITPCNKICKPLVVYRLTGNVMTSITTLRTLLQNYNVFTPKNEISKYLSYDK